MIECREITLGTAQHEAALHLREAILRTPIGLEWTDEDFLDEPRCLHLGAFEGDELVAALMLKLVEPGVYRMRQVAVATEQQRRGIGAALIPFAEEAARRLGGTRMIAHARVTALPFYRKLGYEEEGEMFIEATIPHRLVWKAL